MKTRRGPQSRELPLVGQRNAHALLKTNSAELSEAHLQLFEHDVAFDVFFSFSNYTSCSSEKDTVEGIDVQTAFANA